MKMEANYLESNPFFPSQQLNSTPHMAAINITSFKDKNITLTVLYNDTTQHSLPVVLNIIANAIQRTFSGSSDLQPIEIKSHPFQQTALVQEFNLGTFSSALFVGMIFVLVPVSLSVDMVYDREMRAKNQLRVNGLTTVLYFAAYFVVMACLMILICAALLIMVFVMNIPSFKQPAALVTLAILIVLYSPSAILCSTVFSYFFNRTDSALSFLPNILTFVGLIPFCLVAFLDMMGIGE
jgi:ATP-binding cassette, subfamily A (ABC1), member 5